MGWDDSKMLSKLMNIETSCLFGSWRGVHTDATKRTDSLEMVFWVVVFWGGNGGEDEVLSTVQ